MSVGSLVRLLQFEHSNANLVEVTLASDSPAINTNIGDLRLPRDASIVGVIRDDRLIVPNDETILVNGDEVVVLVADEAEAQVRFVLCGESQA